ncbi:cytidine deaminase [Amorphus coralli]|uniref:cytidine deaminase n=1 Tax=Amorphus coralli TaxID=340680 RepID=UPI00037DF7D3|nr:cytidine deaminase [Amorphus coralli]
MGDQPTDRPHPLAELSAEDQALCRAAFAATANAHAPYSRFSVGAALVTASGTVFRGANLENASYGLSICAEAAALVAANNAADRAVTAIAVTGHSASSRRDPTAIVTPCGRCRQMIAEFAALSDTDIRVLCCAGDLSRVLSTSIDALLPHAFGRASLSAS